MRWLSLVRSQLARLRRESIAFRPGLVLLEDRSVPAIDPLFGVGGLSTVAFGLNSNHDDSGATGIAVQSSGRIIIAGPVSDDADGHRDVAVVGLTPYGQIDNDFGYAGVVIFEGTQYGELTTGMVAIEVDNQDRVVVAFTIPGHGKNDIYVARLTPDGDPDFHTAFDITGYTAQIGFNDYVDAVTVDDQDNIFIVGGVSAPHPSGFPLRASLIEVSGTTGKYVAATSFAFPGGARYSVATDVAVQGNTVAISGLHYSSWTLSGIPDSSFAAAVFAINGKLTNNQAPAFITSFQDPDKPDGFANSVAFGGGGILLGGTMGKWISSGPSPGYDDYALAVLTPQLGLVNLYDLPLVSGSLYSPDGAVTMAVDNGGTVVLGGYHQSGHINSGIAYDVMWVNPGTGDILATEIVDLDARWNKSNGLSAGMDMAIDSFNGVLFTGRVMNKPWAGEPQAVHDMGTIRFYLESVGEQPLPPLASPFPPPPGPPVPPPPNPPIVPPPLGPPPGPPVVPPPISPPPISPPPISPPPISPPPISPPPISPPPISPPPISPPPIPPEFPPITGGGIPWDWWYWWYYNVYLQSDPNGAGPAGP